MLAMVATMAFLQPFTRGATILCGAYLLTATALSGCGNDDGSGAGGSGATSTGGAGATSAGGAGAQGALGGDGGTAGAGGDGPEISTTTIGPDGGVAESVDGNFSVTFPPGALATPTDITIETLEVDSVPGGAVGNAYELGPDGLVLDEHAALLTATVDPANLEGEPPQSLALALERDGVWFPILGAPPVQDPNAIRGFTTHFSTYAPVKLTDEGCINQAVDENPDPCSCDYSAVQQCAAELDIFVWGCGWTYAVFPIEGFLEAKLYDALDCYEDRTGYENVFANGGGTQCERDCCRNAQGLYAVSGGIYQCSEPSADGCLAACANANNDKTQCELKGVPVCASCGDGLLHAKEQCEPSVETFTYCTDVGLSGGQLGCNANCTFDTSNCCVPLQADSCPSLTAAQGGECGSYEDGCGGYLFCDCGVGEQCDGAVCEPDPCFNVDCSGTQIPTDYCQDANTVVFHAGPFCSEGECTSVQGFHNCLDDPDFHLYCTPEGLCSEP